MRLRPDFNLLDEYFKRLYGNLDVNQEFLRRAEGHIELCERIIGEIREESLKARTTEYDKANSKIVRTRYWWNKRAEPFGMSMKPRGLLAHSPGKKYEFTAADRKFLRSLHIGVGPSEDEDSE